MIFRVRTRVNKVSNGGSGVAVELHHLDEAVVIKLGTSGHGPRSVFAGLGRRAVVGASSQAVIEAGGRVLMGEIHGVGPFREAVRR